MDPVGGGAPQPDLGMLFVDLAEGLITRRAVGQLVVGKAVILIGSLTRAVGGLAHPAADRADGGRQPLGQPLGQAAEVDAHQVHAKLEHGVPQHFRAHAVGNEVHGADVRGRSHLLEKSRQVVARGFGALAGFAG